MNKDLGKSFTDQDTAYHIRNYKLTTDRGLSTVNLTSESGNQLSFKLPEVLPYKQYLDDNNNVLETVPALNGSDLTIIGVTTIVDDIVLFSTDNTGIGQIWWVKYDYILDQVIGLIGGQYLDPSVHLVYNRQLGFSTAHRIKAVGKYETSTITRIYWTDNFNPVRALNLMKPDVEPGLLAINSIVNMSQPNVLLTGAGNLPAGTMVQFTYRLFDANGNLTIFAPLSEIYPLPLSSLLSDAWVDISGDGDPTVDTNKSVTYEIKGIDTNYEFIEHVIVIYTAPDVYTAYSYADRQVPSDGYVRITCSDINDAVVIDPVELNMLSSSFDVAKDIEIKDERLIAVNTKSIPFEIEFDARAYRFNSGRYALIKDETGATEFNIDGNAASVSYPSLVSNDATIDAINPYNNENDANWSTNSQYKYQSDGSTLGGEGPRIKYTFVTHDVVADYTPWSSITTSPPHVTNGRWGFSPGESLGVIERNQTGRVLVKTSHFKDNNSGYIPAYYRGYARGEVYRFGIVFFSKSHQPSFVKWIGDIRFPEPCEIGHMGVYSLMTTSGSDSVMNSIGLEFQVDISGFEDQISGFQIVRVQRHMEDRTRLGTGMLMGFRSYIDKATHTSIIEAYDGAFPVGYDLTDNVLIYGVLENGLEWHLNDFPQRGNLRYFRNLISPINQEYEINHTSSDFIKTFGYYKSKPQHYNNTAGAINQREWGFYYRLKDFSDIVSAGHLADFECFEVQGNTIARVGEFFDTGDSFLGTYPLASIRNASYCRDNYLLSGEGIPFGLGSQKIFLRLDETPSLINCINPSTSESWYSAGGHLDNYDTSMVFVGDTGNDVYFKEVAYCRHLSNQYGGSDYVARQSNQYISTGHFQPIDEDVLSTVSTSISGSVITNSVFGGDVFVNYFDDEYIQMYRNVETAYKEPYNDPINNKLSVAVLCPVESPVNTDFIIDERWASNRDGFAMSTYENNSYEYNWVFSQENTTEQKFFAQDALVEINNEHRHRVWASEQKTDGELIDNWRQFKVGNSIEVNGTHGGLNRVINFRDQMYFYQDKAFGALAIDKEAVIPDEFGVEMTLGKGRTLDFGYISQTTGAFHQWGVINSDNALYHFDARLKRLFRFTGQGLEDVSAAKGFTSHFDKYDGELLTTDQTILGKGIETVWDNRNNRLIFTFLNHKKISSVPPEEYLEFREGDIFIKDGSYYFVDDYSSHFRQGFEDYFPSEINGILLNDYIHGETVGYNEMFDCFESFYDYKPGLYINTNRSLFSVNPFDKNSTWIHNRKNLYNSYYGFTYPYEVESVLIGQEGLSHVFNNVTYQDECFNPYGKDIYDKSFDKYKARNEYQNTGYVNLTDDNYKRRMRASHFKIGRDFIDGKSRMRSPWMRLKLVLDNHEGNIRHILHNLIYGYNSNNY